MENKNLEHIKNWLSENIAGLLAIIAGLILITFTYEILVNLILFSTGAILIYVGLIKLHVKPVTDFINKMGAKIKKFLS
jgi:hypothetical protein